MTKVALFIPTAKFGGLDVTEASIERQTIKPDLLLVSDEIPLRMKYWNQIVSKNEIENWAINNNAIARKPGNRRNLCAAYNWAAQKALYYECDIFISLQDYIWIAENGIERFVKIHEANPNALITGLTHISHDPTEFDIADINSPYSIFNNSFREKPKHIDWFDVRATEIYETSDGDIFPIYPDHWEANWASAPVSKFKEGCFWDEEFDKGIAYENADFAKTCVEKTGAEILLDIRNEAISLPHKDYFLGEREEIEQYSNRWRYEAKWGI